MSDKRKEYNGSKGSNPELTRAYEIGFTALAEYVIEQFEKYSPEKAKPLIEKYIDQFYNKNIYSMILPKDKKAIDNLTEILKKALQ